MKPIRHKLLAQWIYYQKGVYYFVIMEHYLKTQVKK